MTFAPILAYWCIALWGLVSPRPILLWLTVLSIPFGSLAIVPTTLTAGLTFTPLTMTALLVCLREFGLHRNGLRFLYRTITRLDQGLLLVLFLLLATVLTLFMPRILAGQIVIVPMRPQFFMETRALQPTAQNLSQLGYLIISIGATFAFFHMLRRPGMPALLARVWVAGAILLLATGLLDLLSQFLPLSGVLGLFRTASYAILANADLQGSQRIIGLMPEASAFGSTCLLFLSLLYFLRHGLPTAGDRRNANIICALLAGFVILSTSSAAYVGLGTLGALAILDWGRRHRSAGIDAGLRQGSFREFTIAAAVFALLCGIVILSPDVLTPIADRLQYLLLDKVDSRSYLERSMWTQVSFAAGIDSHFLGVGLGSTRASNSLAVLFGSTGLLGVLLYYAFVAQLLLRPIPPETDRLAAWMVRAVRLAFWPMFVIGLLIGTTADFGVTTSLQWGLILAVCAAPRPLSRRGSNLEPDARQQELFDPRPLARQKP